MSLNRNVEVLQHLVSDPLLSSVFIIFHLVICCETALQVESSRLGEVAAVRVPYFDPKSVKDVSKMSNDPNEHHVNIDLTLMELTFHRVTENDRSDRAE